MASRKKKIGIATFLTLGVVALVGVIFSDKIKEKVPALAKLGV